MEVKMSNEANPHEGPERAVGKILRASHTGTLRIGEMMIPCAVLEDEARTRVLSERAALRALGLHKSGTLLRSASDDAGGRLPLFVAHKALRPFINNDLALVLGNPILYHNPKGGRFVNGVDARLIPQICEVWLRARDAGALGRQQQEGVAFKADMLMRALAHVGIIALVDEATGFQRDRAKDALARILEQFISKDLERWARVFPDDFYRELFRLREWTVSDITKRPGHTAQLTNDIVYLRLAPGVLDALKKVQERNEHGRPKHKLHQRLTPEHGQQRLREHRWAVVALMKASPNWAAFQRSLNRALPRQDVDDLFPGEGYAKDPEGEE
jgi:hypothetical protein